MVSVNTASGLSGDDMDLSHHDDSRHRLVRSDCQYIHKEPPWRDRDSNHGIGRSVPSTDLSLKARRERLSNTHVLDLLEQSILNVFVLYTLHKETPFLM